MKALKAFILKLAANFLKILTYGTALLLLLALSQFLLQTKTKQQSKYSYLSGELSSSNKILQIPVHGLILGSSSMMSSGLLQSGGMFTFGYEVRQALKDAAEDPQIKAALIHLMTPGGTIYGSQAVAEGIQLFKEAGKPVYAFVEGLAASGGVWAFATAEKVFADAGSMIGSVGVIGGQFYYYDEPYMLSQGFLGGSVETKSGIEQTIIHAGKGKDLGNPFRKLTTRERALLQQAVDENYQKFLDFLKKHRAIDKDKFIDEIGASVLSVSQAKSLNLIDEEVSYPGTVSRLAERAGLKDGYQVVMPPVKAPTFFKQLLGVVQEPSQHVSCEKYSSQVLVYYGSYSQFCSMF